MHILLNSRRSIEEDLRGMELEVEALVMLAEEAHSDAATEREDSTSFTNRGRVYSED